MSKTIRILVCDDQEEDVEFMRQELKDSALSAVLERVDTEKAYRDALDRFEPDMIFSDYVLYEFSGFTAMETARKKFPNIPFLFVSQLIHEDSVIETLERGATDYVFI